MIRLTDIVKTFRRKMKKDPTFLIFIVLFFPGVLAAQLPEREYWEAPPDSQMVREPGAVQSISKGYSPLALVTTGLIRGYQVVISTQDLPSCNFTPSCSQFALRAINSTGAFRGTLLAADRLMRCNFSVRRHYHFNGTKFDDPVSPYLSLTDR